ncbi:MAG: hypothetical protein AB4372_00750 [Xenococcus sp. (in: cyanobacteria)]
MKIINDEKLPFEYPFKEALAIYWDRIKQTLSILLRFLIFFAIFVVSRYIYILNKNFFLRNLDFLIPFGLAVIFATVLIGMILLIILSYSKFKITMFSTVLIGLILLIILSFSEVEIQMNVKDIVKIMFNK